MRSVLWVRIWGAFTLISLLAAAYSGLRFVELLLLRPATTGLRRGSSGVEQS
jgi:hypothetical protein